MRLPFPERVPISGVAVFVVVLFLVQWAEGTALYFSLGCAAFIMIAAVAFNLGGGLTRTPGAYVFFYSMLVVIVGVVYKAYLGEPAQSNLLDPRTDIEVYVGGISAMLAAVLVSRRFSRRKPLLGTVLKESMMYRASVGCMVFGALGGFIIMMLGEQGLRLITAFTQLNQLIPLGIIIGVMYEIRRSGGTRSLNIPILLGAAYCFVYYGLLAYSKQGMLTPLYCWLLPVCALRYRLSRAQIISICVGVFVIFYFLVPYAQYGRRFLEPGQTVADRAEISLNLLENPTELRRNYEADPGTATYYNSPQGFWDRLQFLSVDDQLVDITDHGKVYGLLPIPATALNAIPHVIWPNKPNLNFGNVYAHEIGKMSEYDTSTGISFSPTSEAYHMAKWVGVLVVAPLVWFVLFVLFDSMLGDLRTTPWGLLALTMLSHSAPEGSLSGLVTVMTTTGTEAIVFCAFFSAWVAPIFAVMVLGAEQSPVRRLSFRSPKIDPAWPASAETLSSQTPAEP